MAGKLGSKRIKWNQWDALLGTMPDKQLASKVGCVVAAVIRRRLRLGIQPPIKAGWTEADQGLLEQGLQKCITCGAVLPLSAFYTEQRSRFGKRRVCHTCRGIRDRAYTTGLKREWVVKSGGQCQCCGFSEWLAPLDFHHVNGGPEYVPSRLVARRKHTAKADAELDKCCLLCANCHRAFHSGELRLVFIKREGLGWTIEKSATISPG